MARPQVDARNRRPAHVWRHHSPPAARLVTMATIPVVEHFDAVLVAPRKVGEVRPPGTRQRIEVNDPVRSTRPVSKRGVVLTAVISVPDPTVPVVGIAATVQLNPAHRRTIVRHRHRHIGIRLIH